MRRLPIRFARLILALAPIIGLAQIEPWARAQIESGPWRFVDPASKAVIGVDWKRISRSEVGVMLREKWLNPEAGAIPGIEFLDDVDRFLVSSPGGDPSGQTEEAPLLVVATGHFELAKVRALLLARGTKPQQFNSWLVYRPQGKNAKDLAVVLFDAGTILIGDSRSIFSSLDRSAFQHAAPEANSILARAAEMDAAYDAWALVTAPGTLASNRLTELLTGAGLDSEAQGFEAGISLRTGLAADITVLFSSEDDAKSMATELAKIVHLAAKDQSGEPFLQDFEKRLKFASDGPRTRISLRLTPRELEKNAQLFAARKRAPAIAPDVRPVAKAAPAPAPVQAPEKLVIRIEGLDGGTREIPFPQHQQP
jgi:hypothetical protein